MVHFLDDGRLDVEFALFLDRLGSIVQQEQHRVVLVLSGGGEGRPGQRQPVVAPAHRRHTQRNARAYPNAPVVRFRADGVAGVRLHDLLHQVDIGLLQRCKRLVAHFRRLADAAEKVGRYPAQVDDGTTLVNHIDTIVEREAADLRRALQLATGAHLLHPHHGLAEMAIAPPLSLVRDHVGLDQQRADDLAFLVVDGKDILDDGRAVAEDLALASPAAAAVQRLEEQRLILGVEDAAGGIAAIKR